MRSFALITLLTLAGGSTMAHAAETTQTIKVSGWHCGGCSASTEQALKKLEGVKSVTSDFEKGTASVTFDDSRIKLSDLERAITESGYKVKR